MHLSTSSVLLYLIASASCTAASPLYMQRSRRSALTTSTWKPSAFKSPTTDRVKTPHVLELTKINNKGNARSAVELNSQVRTGSTNLVSFAEVGGFATSITIGNQTFEVVIDTGSSDLWVVREGFICINPESRREVPQWECEFGPAYAPNTTFHEIVGEFVDIKYADREILSGVIGTENVTLAGITVNQTFGVMDYAGWYGDGVTSGLMGLAYSSLANAYTTDYKQPSLYNPIFATMYEQGLIDPVFSIVMNRNASNGTAAGYLTLGGLPPTDIKGNFSTTPILVTNIKGYRRDYDFYTVNIDGVALGNKSLPEAGGNIQYLVDSGTTLNYYPNSVADAINAAFIPQRSPVHGVTIAGSTFYINSTDMILPGGTDNSGNKICISGINAGGDVRQGIFVLGGTFLRNVVAVFDVGAAEMRFAASA
ncbi:pepsin-like aspartic protease [Aspergillus novofumigatus IBT 16806]|uniref:Putative aspartic-type endopeptidase n=1 Tax=Aspergillus novofumigatus (strain IBT 16806) TaxID=1392255 RepID=A0A2I1BVD8_ASPN1|nr:putative aspartic-type endopeptidase [Aspergillus novofumigatus IBT 16806]PKX89325.1 putative aspartic-type endopeptidase [Aspergillus novofumigatus IBT 16806]